MFISFLIFSSFLEVLPDLIHHIPNEPNILKCEFEQKRFVAHSDFLVVAEVGLDHVRAVGQQSRREILICAPSQLNTTTVELVPPPDLIDFVLKECALVTNELLEVIDLAVFEYCNLLQILFCDL